MEVTARATNKLMCALDRNEAQRRAGDAEMLEILAKLDDRWPDDPRLPDLPSELAARQGISAHTAGERLRIARALAQLPLLRAAHKDGRISWDQLRWLTRFVTPDTEADWAPRAIRMPPWQLKLEADRQARVKREQAERDHAMRSLWMAWDEERRFLDIHATLAAEQGAAVEAALNEAAQHIDVEADVEDRRGARLADALVGLVTSSNGRAQRSTLVVHADAEVLAGVSDGARHLAETSSGTQLPADAVRRLACDAKVTWAVEREERPVGIISQSRKVTDHQMEMLVFRDRGCTFPGCGSTWFLHAHHIRHWADGGKTALDNLTTLCGSHHRRVHDGGWTIRGRPPDGLEFVSPTGKVMKRASPILARAG
jgi:hypothetical protein